MLRITNQTTPTTLNNVGRLMLSGLVTAATFAAISFASSAAIGQEKETMDPPTPAATPNINRWKSEFKFPLGAPPNKVFAVEKKKIDGYELSIVQLRGTFMESSGGPFSGKKTPRENYMMKAVIISPVDADAKTPKCFIKLVGSEKTLKQHAKAYDAMVKSMKTQAVVE